LAYEIFLVMINVNRNLKIPSRGKDKKEELICSLAMD
jgi:hypothetical protein